MSPAELLDLIREKVTGPLVNTVIYSGTVKMETDDFIFADRFTGSLTDPVLNRHIEFAYDVSPLDYMA